MGDNNDTTDTLFAEIVSDVKTPLSNALLLNLDIACGRNWTTDHCHLVAKVMLDRLMESNQSPDEDAINRFVHRFADMMIYRAEGNHDDVMSVIAFMLDSVGLTGFEGLEEELELDW